MSVEQTSARQRWYKYLNEPSVEDKVSLVIALSIATVILLNIGEILIGSIPKYAIALEEWFLVSSSILVSLFVIEYLLRIWVSAEKPHASNASDWSRRRDYILSPMGIVDLLSFLPFLLWWLLPEAWLSDLRMLKLIAMARIFKLTRYSAPLGLLTRVYEENKHTLLAALMVMMILMFMASTGMYIFERHAQPEAFGSIPASMWWAFVTLTTVGYGDVTPITVAGKVFGAVVTVCGVGVAAMPAGIFASSFVQLIKEQERQKRLALKAKHHESYAEEIRQLHLEMTASEKREVDYLMEELGLTLDQAIGVVSHFRR
jgi:voltage-gated potassium channel